MRASGWALLFGAGITTAGTRGLPVHQAGCPQTLLPALSPYHLLHGGVDGGLAQGRRRAKRQRDPMRSTWRMPWKVQAAGPPARWGRGSS